VYVVANGRADERIVTVGEKGPGFVEITSGVSEREQVVSEPRGRVVDGMPIAPQ